MVHGCQRWASRDTHGDRQVSCSSHCTQVWWDRELQAGAVFLSDKASGWGPAASLPPLAQHCQIFSFWRDVARVVVFCCVKVLVCSSDLREKWLLLFLRVWKQGDQVSESFLICLSLALECVVLLWKVWWHLSLTALHVFKKSPFY